jgi:hypothetical protein
MSTEEMAKKLRDLHERSMGAARDSILAVIREHERVCHDGGYCLEESVNAVAFIAHALGLKANHEPTWTYVREVLGRVYEAHHDAHAARIIKP